MTFAVARIREGKGTFLKVLIDRFEPNRYISISIWQSGRVSLLSRCAWLFNTPCRRSNALGSPFGRRRAKCRQ